VRKRARGQDHRDAARLVATVRPHGSELAKRLERLLASKDEAHYGSKLVSRRSAASLVRAARELTELAGDVVTANP
jgi:hypothetical protein